jgi:hypothetical protein
MKGVGRAEAALDPISVKESENNASEREKIQKTIG